MRKRFTPKVLLQIPCSILFGHIFGGRIIGIGIGTLASAIFIGQTILFLNKHIKERLLVIGNTTIL